MDATKIEVGQFYRYPNGQIITVNYVGSDSVTFVNRSGYTVDFTLNYLSSNSCPLTLVGVDELARQTKDQRIKELEDKLSKCQEIAMGLGIKYNEQQDKLKIAVEECSRLQSRSKEKTDVLLESNCEIKKLSEQLALAVQTLAKISTASIFSDVYSYAIEALKRIEQLGELK